MLSQTIGISRDYWSIKSYSDNCRNPGAQPEVFHITYYQILLISDAEILLSHVPNLRYWMQPQAFIFGRDRIQDLVINHIVLTFFCSILDCLFVEKG